MPRKKPVEIILPKPAKIGLPTQLAAIQDRYRRAMLVAYDRPLAVRSSLIRAALDTLLAEQAALGVKDGEEATSEV